MTKLILISMFFFSIINSCIPSNNNDVVSLEIEFDGGEKEFYQKYNLWLEIKDTSLVNKILDDFNSSKKMTICPSLRPVMWEIDVFGKYSKDDSKHLFKVGSNTFNKLSLQKGNLCFDNKPLINELIRLTKAEEIGKFEGKMTQFDYDLILQKEN